MTGLQETGRGRSTRRPKPRPDHDSLPHFECETSGCGGPLDRQIQPGEVGVFDFPSTFPLVFCSLGCASRWAGLQELRS